MPFGRAAQDLNGPDKLEAVEKEMQQAFQHIGAAASIAEMYAQRMRAFQRAGNEPRAIAAFKLAVDWMGTLRKLGHERRRRRGSPTNATSSTPRSPANLATTRLRTNPSRKLSRSSR